MNNYVVILDWMCQDLKLSGNELLIYALIYGFCQDNSSYFFGSRNYIAKTFNISKPTVDKALKSLVEKNLIIKEEMITNNVLLYKYKILLPVKKSYYPGKEILPNNINNTNTINTINKSKNKYNKCIDVIEAYTENKELREILILYLKLRLEMKEKPIFVNQWKGLLNKLSKLTQDDLEKITIVQQSLDRGYASFYPLKSFSKDVYRQKVISEQYTEEEIKELDRLSKEREKRGQRTKF